MDKLRIDKWIWAVRLAKTRSQAGRACREGKVWLNEKKAGPSELVKVGDHIRLKRYKMEKRVEVQKLIEKRVNASLAAECYIDHSPEKAEIELTIKLQKGEVRESGSGRPTKRDRRNLDEFKGQNG